MEICQVLRKELGTGGNSVNRWYDYHLRVSMAELWVRPREGLAAVPSGGGWKSVSRAGDKKVRITLNHASSF